MNIPFARVGVGDTEVVIGGFFVGSAVGIKDEVSVLAGDFVVVGGGRLGGEAPTHADRLIINMIVRPERIQRV